MAWNSGLQIRVLDGSDRGKVFPLDAQEMTLGRALDPKEKAPGWILFSEPTVSRVHAVLQWKEAQRGYLLQHRSRTNPTMVNGKPVDQHLLQPGQKVQLGLLIFSVEVVEIRTGRLGDAVQTPSTPEPKPTRRPNLKGPVLGAVEEPVKEKAREPMEGLAGLADEAPVRGRRQAHSSPGGLVLVAAQGPDQGSRFHLHETLLVLGRRIGPDDPRQSAGVLLNDDSLPSEQALLVWHDREYTYGILQSEGSPVPTRLRRVMSGIPKDINIGSDLPTPLYEGDVIMAGQSSLVVRRFDPDREGGEAEDPETRPRFRASPRPSWSESREQRRDLGGLDSGDSKKADSPRTSSRTWRDASDDEAPPLDRPKAIEPEPPPKPLKPQSRPRSIRAASVSSSATPRKERPGAPAPPPKSSREKPASPEPSAPKTRRRSRQKPPVVEAPEEPLAMPPPPPRAAEEVPEEPLAMPPPPPRAAEEAPEEPLAMPPPPPRATEEVPEEPLAMPPPPPREPEEVPEEPLAMPPPPPLATEEVPEEPLAMPPPPPREPEVPLAMPPPQPPVQAEEPPEPESLEPEPLPVTSLETTEETPEEMPAVGGIVLRGLPPHLERSLRGGRMELEPPAAEVPAVAQPDVPLFDPEAFGRSTTAWRHHADFVVGYLEGSRKGQKVDLLGSEFSEDRVLTIGSPGQRFNDIEVDDAEISNDQAIMRYRSGRFTLVNNRSEIQVNSLALGEGDEVVLMTGDRIHLGDTVLLFLERRVVEALRNLRMEVLEGVRADMGKTFDLNKERLMIGRGRNCDIRLADPEVSRVHCVLVLRNNRFFVQHRSETNPTFVNGISLLPGAERQVVVGDRIQVSSQTVLQFLTRS